MNHQANNITGYIKQLAAGQMLSNTESYELAQLIFTEATNAQIASVLTLLRTNGESVANIIGFIRALRTMCAHSLNISRDCIDIVGTGGDYANTYNISTGAALLVAACGVKVVKHGNRAVTSLCGSADVLAQLGYNIYQTPQELEQSLAKDNFAFCFAPHYYPQLQQIALLRKELAIPTIFNLLGPLLNPAQPDYIIVGVSKAEKMQLIAEVIAQLPYKRALVVHGNGLDEISCLGNTTAILIDNTRADSTQLSYLEINPLDYGLSLCSRQDITAHSLNDSVFMLHKTLSGINTPLTDTIILNAACALFVAGAVLDIASGVVMARERLIAGNVLSLNKLQQIILRKRFTLNDSKKLKHKSFTAVISNANGAVIGELKQASPALGKIRQMNNLAQTALDYIASGVSAISVLTDEGFAGSIEDLKQVSQALQHTPTPILRKDFIFTQAQIIESKLAGADAILLMVAVVGEQTKQLVEFAHLCGLETLVEVHAASELEIALSCGSDMIGINSRDLTDFTVHNEVFIDMLGQLPADTIKIAESGIKSYAMAKSLFAIGYDAVLVGEALSRPDNPQQFFNQRDNHVS